MVDILFDQDVLVRANQQISIMVRYTVGGDQFMAQTLLGYGGENYRHINLNEKEAFVIQESDDCTKGETDLRFGNIPRILYF